jgi:3,4-dihydroxy-2-butanone 4-phosphate synthase
LARRPKPARAQKKLVTASVTMSASHSSATLRLDPFEDVLARFRSGGLVLLVDDTDRENEGDVVLATEAVSPEAISF